MISPADSVGSRKFIGALCYNEGLRAALDGEAEHALSLLTLARDLLEDQRPCLLAAKVSFAIGDLEKADELLSGIAAEACDSTDLETMRKAPRDARDGVVFDQVVAETAARPWLVRACDWIETLVREHCREIRERESFR